MLAQVTGQHGGPEHFGFKVIWSKVYCHGLRAQGAMKPETLVLSGPSAGFKNSGPAVSSGHG